MKILVIGCGSIGKRHIRNIKALIAGNIVAYDIDPKRCSEVEQKYGIVSYNDLEEALSQKPDVAFICTPSSLHVAPALAAAQKGCHLFIEKPLSHSLDNVDELIEIVAQKGLVTLVGCNLRFHPGIATIKDLLAKQMIGKVICARVQAGQYLPDWHPGEDYRSGYSANKSLGGGTILDSIHQIDYVRWFLGDVLQIFCISSKYSSLEIDTEDMAEMLISFQSGAIAEIHLDYIQRFYGHSCHIIGEQGTILWDIHDKQVKLYSADIKQWASYPEKPDYDINEMYIDEMRHFLKCLDGEAVSMQDVKAGKKALEIALAAKESASMGKPIQLKG